MPILETAELTRRFHQQTAVDRVSIAVEPGEIFGLLGPNGAGKTTTIKMLTTLLPPSDGRAWICGYDVARQPAAVRRLIGYVPQAVSADGALTGAENLQLFAKLYDLPRAEREPRIQSLLDQLGLTEAANRLVQTYSGGMIRRLEIGQALLHEPQVLFLDEPTVGLDPVARKIVWENIESMRAQFGVTMLLTTHYMEEADSLCSRIAIMHRGRIVALGTPAELKASLGTPNPTLDDVFAHYTGDSLEVGGAYRETLRTRRTARRVG
jgi:ABC-2 type transport system ATP-binding protein